MWLWANENDAVTDSKMKTAVTYRIVISGVAGLKRPAWLAGSLRGSLIALRIPYYPLEPTA